MGRFQKKLSKKRTGLRPNWDNHNAETCCYINYISDCENTELILLRQEIQIQNECDYCNESEKCSKFGQYRKEFKKIDFWTINKNVRVWEIFDPDWSVKTVFLMKPVKSNYDNITFYI